MPIIGPIPLPGNPWDELSNIPAEIEANRLRRAQAEAAHAKAQQATMIAQLLKGALGGAGTGTTGINDVNRALLLSGATGMPTQTVEGQIVTPFGTYKVGETPAEKRMAETQKTVGQKALEATSESAMGNLGTNASISALQELTENPDYERVAGHLRGKAINAQPFGLPVGAFLQQQFPGAFTQKDADLASQAETHYGNIVSNMANNFKGPFKNLVNGIIQRMKPNMGDSIATQKGKLKALSQLSQLSDKQDELISNYVNQGLDPTSAILRSTQQLMPEFKKLVSSSVIGNTPNPMANTPPNPGINQPSTPLERKVGGKLSKSEGRETQPEGTIEDKKVINGIERVKMNGVWYKRKK